MNYDVFDELFVFQKCVKREDIWVYNRYVLREPNKTLLSYLLSELNIVQADKLKLFETSGELVKYPDGRVKLRNPDTLVGTATITLK